MRAEQGTLEASIYTETPRPGNTAGSGPLKPRQNSDLRVLGGAHSGTQDTQAPAHPPLHTCTQAPAPTPTRRDGQQGQASCSASMGRCVWLVSLTDPISKQTTEPALQIPHLVE